MCELCGKCGAVLSFEILLCITSGFGVAYIGKRFHAQYLVKMHILHTHAEYRKYICSQCPKRFSSTTDLTIHTNVHHSEVNPYKCETCDKVTFIVKDMVVLT